MYGPVADYLGTRGLGPCAREASVWEACCWYSGVITCLELFHHTAHTAVCTGDPTARQRMLSPAVHITWICPPIYIKTCANDRQPKR